MGKNPTDRGKIGTKRSVLTEGGGVPIGLAVEGANRNDFKMVEATLTSIGAVLAGVPLYYGWRYLGSGR